DFSLFSARLAFPYILPLGRPYLLFPPRFEFILNGIIPYSRRVLLFILESFPFILLFQLYDIVSINRHTKLGPVYIRIARGPFCRARSFQAVFTTEAFLPFFSDMPVHTHSWLIGYF